MSFRRTPDDANFWDDRWRIATNSLDATRYNPDIRPLDFPLQIRLIPLLRSRSITDVLFVGNGIAQTPRAFAYAGFRVVALDISSVATTSAEHFVLLDNELRLFFQFGIDGVSAGGDFSAQYKRIGGSIRFVTGDLHSASVEPGPFGCLIASRSLQGDRIRRSHTVALALDGRMVQAGVLFLLVQNDPLLWATYREAFLSLGYSERERDSGKKLLVGGVASG